METGSLRKQLLFFFIPFFTVYILLLTTIPPSVYHGDSGETISTSFTLGIQHPPGYPLCSMLGKIFTALPLADISFRIYLMSLFISMINFYLLSVLFTRIIRLSGIKGYSGLFVYAPSMLFTAGYFIWQQSIQAKGSIYMINLMFILLISISIASLYSGGGRRYFYLTGFLYGLSFGNHHMSQIALFPAYTFFIYNSGVLKDKNLKDYSLLLLFFMAGFSSYIYLPIRGASAILNWGEPVTFEKFMQVFIRYQYVGSEITKSFINSFRQIVKVITSAGQQTAWAGLLLAIAGGYYLYKRNKNIFWYLTIIPSIFTLLTAVYLNLPKDRLYVMETYITPIYITTSILAALGIFFVARRIFKDTAAVNAEILLILLLFTVQTVFFYPKLNKSRYFFAHDYIRNMLTSLEKGSVIFTTGDGIVFPLWYFRYVKGARKDVTLVGSAVLPMKWVRDNIKKQNPGITMPRLKTEKIGKESIGVLIDAIIKLNFKKFPLYFAYNKPEEKALDPSLVLVPKGTAFKVIPRQYSGISGQYLLAVKNIWKTYALRTVFPPYRNYADKKAFSLYVRDYAVILNATGTYFEEKGDNNTSYYYYNQAHKIEPGDHEFVYNMGNSWYYRKNYKKALEMYHKCLEMNPEYENGWFNLGVTYYTTKNYSKALYAFREVIKINPERDDVRSHLESIERMLKYMPVN